MVHTHNLLAHDYAALALLGRRRRVFLNTRHGMGGTPVGRLRAILYRLSMRRTGRVVAVCEAAKHNLIERERLPAAKIVCVPNGIPIDTFSVASPAAHERLATTLGLDAARRIVGFVGRLNWAKDLPTLLRAFAQVHAQRLDSALVLVGDGALRAQLTALAATQGIAAQVHFLGDRSDVRELLQGFRPVRDVLGDRRLLDRFARSGPRRACPIVATAVGRQRRDSARRRQRPHRAAGRCGRAGCGHRNGARRSRRSRADGRRGREWALREATVERMHTRYRALYESIAKGSA